MPGPLQDMLVALEALAQIGYTGVTRSDPASAWGCPSWGGRGAPRGIQVTLGPSPQSLEKLKEIGILWGTFLIKDWDVALNEKCLHLLAFSSPFA